MSCGTAAPTFRLLDGYVGWDETSRDPEATGLVGFDDAAGLRLRPRDPDGDCDPARLIPYVPPRRLAYDCATCTWYLASEAPPATRLLRLGPCDAGWEPLDWYAVPPLESLTGIAVHEQLLAGADAGSGRVWVWTRAGDLQAAFAAPDVLDVTIASPCELVVALASAPRVRWFDPAGVLLDERDIVFMAAAGPVPGLTIERIAAGGDGGLWIVTRDGVLWQLRCGDDVARPSDLRALAQALPNTGLRAASDAGFCLSRARTDDEAEPECYSWLGRARGPLPAPAPPALVTRGQLLTEAVDSGIPRCAWHRLRIDADVPDGASLAVAVATLEQPGDAPAQGQAEPGWNGFAAGTPHPADWFEVSGVVDTLIHQPPGRYLLLRLRLRGDGKVTPVVRRLRLDFPRATSLDLLPSVYREDVRGEDFTARFLALFDAALDDLDTAVERFPALFDTARVREELLPWLAQFLDTSLDAGWGGARRRAILAALPRLFPKRGTVAGLREAVRIVTGVEVAIEEPGLMLPWGAVAASGTRRSLDARLGETRLFGHARARFRLGRSPLARVPLRSYGNPDRDPYAAGAHRVRVHVPADALANPTVRRILERLVRSQVPAHTVVSLHGGAGVPRLDREVRVGIDTRLTMPTPPVLGPRGTARLRRDAVLRGGRAAGVRVGQTSVPSHESPC